MPQLHRLHSLPLGGSDSPFAPWIVPVSLQVLSATRSQSSIRDTAPHWTLETTTAGEELSGIRLLHPCWNVARAVKHAPNINMVLCFNVEHGVREAPERPREQARQVEVHSVA